MPSLEEMIDANLAQDPADVRTKLAEIETIKVNLPPGELAIYASPRDDEWHLPFYEERAFVRGPNSVFPNDALVSVMRANHQLWAEHPDAPFNLLAQPLLIHELVTQKLQEIAARYMELSPEKFAVGRLDVIIHPDGTVELCEDDDMASLWGNSHEYNQIVESHMLGFIDRRQAEGRKVVATELPEIAYSGERSEAVIFGTRKTPDGVLYSDQNDLRPYHYQHNDIGWHGTHIPFVPLHELQAHHLVIGRGRRGGTFIAGGENPELIDFKTYMDRLEGQSLTPTHLRDCKIALPAMQLGVLATREDAFEAAKEMFKDGTATKLAVKGLFSARSNTLILKNDGGKRLRSQFTLKQGRARVAKLNDEFGRLVIVQPAYEHETAANLGLEFGRNDRQALLEYPHMDLSGIKNFIPGEEGKVKVICRLFVLFDPDHYEKPLVLGGLASGMRSEVVHNDHSAAVWPVYCEGVEAYPDILPYYQRREGMRGLEEKIAKQALKVLHGKFY